MIGNVVVLGLRAAINPILVGVVLVILASPRPKALLGAYVAGGMIVSVAIGIAAVSLASSTGAVKPTTSTTNGLVDLVLGLLLLAVSAWFATGRAERRHAGKVAAAAGRPKKPSVSDRLLGGSRATMAFAAGMLLTLPSALYLAALKDIAEAGVSTGEELLAILLFNVLMLSPALIPLVLLAVVPDGTKAAVERSDRWMREHQKPLVTVVAGAIGVYLTVQGIVALAG
ncbi:MAG TPA: GAP family protein [Solirubrobacteraceae bacterium]|nr:GAP family protein [Solirubrobacteraceae bacterium]